MKPIDYLPLSSSVSFADIRAYFKRTGKMMLTGTIVIGIIIFAISLFGPLPAVIGVLFGKIPFEVAIPSIVGLAFMGFILLILSVAVMSTATQAIRMKRFADANGFDMVENVHNPSHAGMIFDEGSDRVQRVGIIIPGKDGREIELGNHEYVIGSGKNRRTISFGFVRIKLSRQLPHMVLDAKSNNFFGMMSNLPDSFNRSQRLSLEGDFDNYFSLYAPQQYERDALYVLTPDIMSLLIDKAAEYDLEIVDNNLYLYKSVQFQLQNPEQFSALYELAMSLEKEFDEQTNYYADEKVENRSINAIAVPGRRLKKGFSWGVFLVVAVYVLYFIFNMFDVWNRFE